MMKTAVVVAFLLVALATASAADKIDPRLAKIHTAWIEAVDELAQFDRPVAACVADRIHAVLPIDVASTKADADVVLLVGVKSGYALTTARLPDGTVLWSEKRNTKSGFGIYKITQDACGIADRVLDSLRGAMQKARDSK